MVYVALLRGINVGGNNKINMKLLKGAFEKAGMGSVKTYINSGNIVFTDKDRSEGAIVELLEEAIFEKFGLRIKVLVRNFEDFTAVIKALPESWKNDKSMKSDVMFLWDEAADSSVVESIGACPEVDSVTYVNGTVLWSVDRENFTKSGMNNLPSASLYKQMTIRNVNTVRKVYEIMKETQ